MATPMAGPTDLLATRRSRTVESPSQNTEGASRGPRRHFQACLRCRKRKVKCLGGQPCPNCSRTGHECVYDGAKRVLVSEKYLHELQRSISRPPAASDVEIDAGIAQSRSINTEEPNDDNVANPLAENTASSTTDNFGRHHFVGTSSTWGFAWRVRRLLTTLPFCLSTENLLNEVDDIAYSRLGDTTPACIQDARLLPRETTERYLSNYFYHIAPIWHFVDRSRFFVEHQAQAESLPADYSRVLWDIQFNLVMSLGKLLEQGTKHERSPGESHFFFAQSLITTLNESHAIAQEPILVAQNFCLVSFYFHAINMRNDAYINVGKAMRIAFTQGLHRNLDAISLDAAEQESRVRFWWSLYSLDMTLSSLMGAPVPIREDEITTRNPMPHSRFPAPEPLTQCIRMANLMAIVLSEIYGSRSHNRSLFVHSIRKILEGVAESINSTPPEHRIDLEAKTWHVSRTSATLHLFAHQIIIVAVRPVLLHLVELKVDRISTQGPFSGLPIPSSGIRHLLKKLIDAAVASIRIIASLKYQSQLQTFLAFDVTATFSSAVILSLAMFISSKPFDETGHIQEALQVLEGLGAQGNVSAQKRKDELECLCRDLNTALRGSNAQHTARQGFEDSIPIPDSTHHHQPTGESLAQSGDNLNICGSGPTYLFGPSWDNASTSTFLDEEYFTENFEAFFSQIGEYPELIPLQ